MQLHTLHLPPIGVMGLLAGGVLRAIASLFQWPLPLVLTANVILFIAVAWIVMYDILPLFMTPFHYVRQRFSRRRSFFITLLILFGVLQTITVFLPSGATKDLTTTLAFLSFLSAVVWFVAAYVIGTFTPLIKYMKRTPRIAERITFSDVVTSMAIIITPTVALSFFFSPPGLATSEVSAYRVFITSLLTNALIVAYLYLFIIRPKVFTWRQLGLRKVDREDTSRAFMLFILIAIAVVVVQATVERLGFSLQSYAFTDRDGAYAALAVAVLVTPFVEELYFRGFLFKGLLLHNKLWIAYLVSALLFALLHPPILVMAEVFVIGLFLAYITRETKSIWPAIGIHALNNALVFSYLLFG